MLSEWLTLTLNMANNKRQLCLKANDRWTLHMLKRASDPERAED